MRTWIRKKLGITSLRAIVKLQHDVIQTMRDDLETLRTEFDSRRPCRICGKHRYESQAHTRESTHGLS